MKILPTKFNTLTVIIVDEVEGKAECNAAWTHVDCCGDVGRDNELAGSGDNGGVNDKLSPLLLSKLYWLTSKNYSTCCCRLQCWHSIKSE